MRLKHTIIILPLIFNVHFAMAVDFDERVLGKLFTSPVDRQKIDSSRRGEPQPSTQRISPSSISVNGVVIRSKGKNTVWVNGNKITGSKTVGRMKVLANSLSNKNIKVPLIIDGKPVRIKPGQSWSEDTGDVIDNY